MKKSQNDLWDRESNDLWNENCDKILKQYTRGVIDYKEYCELMKSEEEKILAKRQVKKDDKTRN